jgi:hypothetical protein
MRPRIQLLIATLALTALSAHATIITFDDPGMIAGYGPSSFTGLGSTGIGSDVKGTDITTQYQSEGVEFYFPNPSWGVDYVSDAGHLGAFLGDGGPGNHFLAIDTVPSFSSNVATLVAAFTSPVLASSIAFDLADTESEAPLVTLYDPSGHAIPALNWQNNSLDAHVSYSSSALVGSISFSDTGGRGFVLDNLQFMFAAIPEPATYGLLAAGLALLSLIVRRRVPARAFVRRG